MAPIKYFSSDYEEARAKFLDACSAYGGQVESLKNPNTCPAGGPLHTDVAIFGSRDARSALALGSGTHGVEGFCGSGVQTGLLHDGLTSKMGPDVCIVMIHAINPYGFAHLRRMNENNVDLNRNFIDYSKPYPENPDYDALADAIAPEDYSPQAVEAAIKRLLSYGAEHGQAALQAAISGGQYSHPKGLFFGGHFETWSNTTLRAIMKSYLSNASLVAFVDFHTGLGPHGSCEVVLNEPFDSPAVKRAVTWWGKRAKTTKAGESVSADLYGTLKLAVPKMLPSADVTAVSAEFGTVPYEKIFRAMQAENWLHHHGGRDHPRFEAIKDALRKVFYPYSDEWRALVWDQAKEVVDQALAGLTE